MSSNQLIVLPSAPDLSETYSAADEEIAQAISRVFARLGEKKNRAAARIKFLITKLGIEEFRRIVLEERKIMPEDSRWAGYLDNIAQYKETPVRGPAHLNGHERPEGFEGWYRTNVYQQRQSGFAGSLLPLAVRAVVAWPPRSERDDHLRASLLSRKRWARPVGVGAHEHSDGRSLEPRDLGGGAGRGPVLGARCRRQLSVRATEPASAVDRVHGVEEPAIARRFGVRDEGGGGQMTGAADPR